MMKVENVIALLDAQATRIAQQYDNRMWQRIQEEREQIEERALRLHEANRKLAEQVQSLTGQLAIARDQAEREPLVEMNNKQAATIARMRSDVEGLGAALVHITADDVEQLRRQEIALERPDVWLGGGKYFGELATRLERVLAWRDKLLGRE
jgi:IMP dehydrogenase/GMP reductase